MLLAKVIVGIHHMAFFPKQRDRVWASRRRIESAKREQAIVAKLDRDDGRDVYFSPEGREKVSIGYLFLMGK